MLWALGTLPTGDVIKKLFEEAGVCCPKKSMKSNLHLTFGRAERGLPELWTRECPIHSGFITRSGLVTSSHALVTSSDALATSSFLLLVSNSS